jgi:O-antigen/teichoic acid export membrane protein
MIVATYARWPVTLTTAAATILIFQASAAVGYLQGVERFHLISALRVMEVVAKLAVGVTLVELGTGAWGAISGFAVGAALVLLCGVYHMKADTMAVWRTRKTDWIKKAVFDKQLWASASGIIGIQAGTAIIVGLDVVIASVVLAGDRGLANYQVVQILGRIPFYVASALAIIVFPRMARRICPASSLRLGHVASALGGSYGLRLGRHQSRDHLLASRWKMQERCLSASPHLPRRHRVRRPGSGPGQHPAPGLECCGDQRDRPVRPAPDRAT